MAMGLINTNIFGVSPRSSVCYKILSIMKVLSILYFRILIFNIFFYARNYLMTIQNHFPNSKLMLITIFLIFFIICICFLFAVTAGSAISPNVIKQSVRIKLTSKTWANCQKNVSKISFPLSKLTYNGQFRGSDIFWLKPCFRFQYN